MNINIMSSFVRLCCTLVGSRTPARFFTSKPIGARRFCSTVKEAKDSGAVKLGHTHKPNDFERKVLVWTGKYKTVDEVPGMVK